MRRVGFTLIELLITMLLAAIIGLGVTRLLTSQTRFFSRATGQRDARAVARNAVNIVRDEMRMIEPRGIDSASTTRLVVRVPYAMGVYCSSGTATFAPVDSLTWATATFAGFAFRDTALNATYTYVTSSTAPTTGSTGNCTTAANITPVTGGRTLSITGLPPSSLSPSLPQGAPVLLFQRVTYELAASELVPGRTALWRRVTGGVNEEIAVPFQDGASFRFYVVGADTSQAAPPLVADLRTLSGIEIVLVGESERSASNRAGTPETAPVRLTIFFRNAVL
ncbi:MAG: prepilin-type N-terminal cleavage/methylation domain-containing protein [Gemmatimonadota bacterium]|jgi:prepilin-type N-terminal cleavage/methylation domain-containing protein|nr:prepilin-type N-terminal cleavage/methylation domain-containing protein [Gemmatimonadota bacterium]MDQ8152263.1 prepilin-type N-terminal cleavage/methylation domain-containing protein [Gemmatimonadota bacterium]MDQ8170045.1 prepilin-type N-terminal cleavage/methylation domain-containing protein [Gemmatimonadota bacterium]